MLIGVISDTHDNISCIKKSVDFFNLRNAGIVLHCGDIFSPRAAKEFARLNCGFKAVFGNNDFERAALDNVISDFGIIKEAPFEFKICGKIFIMTHRPVFAEEEKYDYILYGHTHKARIEKTKKGLILNPGEACGFRYGRQTASLIDLQSGNAEIFDL
ncbi:MAG: metallophosphoesterase [Endomicrobium sp.]|jgi:putative phosphoesterase|nr:metallophosphoesterase [Endomicrobium sp.]